MRKEEGKFQDKLIKYLSSNGVYVVKFNASGTSKVGVPDLLACINGSFVGIEVKKEDGVISDAQQMNILQIRKSGGCAICVKPSNFEDIKECLEELNLYELEKRCKGNEKTIKKIVP